MKKGTYKRNNKLDIEARLNFRGSNLRLNKQFSARCSQYLYSITMACDYSKTKERRANIATYEERKCSHFLCGIDNLRDKANI